MATEYRACPNCGTLLLVIGTQKCGSCGKVIKPERFKPGKAYSMTPIKPRPGWKTIEQQLRESFGEWKP